MPLKCSRVLSFFFNDTATTEIYTLSLHDALPIWFRTQHNQLGITHPGHWGRAKPDRKSTRLNSSHLVISYAVFCLKKNTPDAAMINAMLSKHGVDFEIRPDRKS